MFSDGTSVPVLPMVSVFPFAPSSRFASRGRRPLRSAFSGGSARHSPAGATSVLPASRFRGRGPNNALQRTAGWRPALILAFLPAVAELESVRRSSSPLWFARARRFSFASWAVSVPIRSVVAVLLWVRRQLRSALPGGSARLPPPVGGRFPFPRFRSHAPNNALQRTAGWRPA